MIDWAFVGVNLAFAAVGGIIGTASAVVAQNWSQKKEVNKIRTKLVDDLVTSCKAYREIMGKWGTECNGPSANYAHFAFDGWTVLGPRFGKAGTDVDEILAFTKAFDKLRHQGSPTETVPGELAGPLNEDVFRPHVRLSTVDDDGTTRLAWVLPTEILGLGSWDLVEAPIRNYGSQKQNEILDSLPDLPPMNMRSNGAWGRLALPGE